MSARRNTFYRASKFTRVWVQVVRIERVPPAIRGARRQVKPATAAALAQALQAAHFKFPADLDQVGRHVG